MMSSPISSAFSSPVNFFPMERAANQFQLEERFASADDTDRKNLLLAWLRICPKELSEVKEKALGIVNTLIANLFGLPAVELCIYENLGECGEGAEWKEDVWRSIDDEALDKKLKGLGCNQFNDLITLFQYFFSLSPCESEGGESRWKRNIEIAIKVVDQASESLLGGDPCSEFTLLVQQLTTFVYSQGQLSSSQDEKLFFLDKLELLLEIVEDSNYGGHFSNETKAQINRAITALKSDTGGKASAHPTPLVPSPQDLGGSQGPNITGHFVELEKKFALASTEEGKKKSLLNWLIASMKAKPRPGLIGVIDIFIQNSLCRLGMPVPRVNLLDFKEIENCEMECVWEKTDQKDLDTMLEGCEASEKINAFTVLMACLGGLLSFDLRNEQQARWKGCWNVAITAVERAVSTQLVGLDDLLKIIVTKLMQWVNVSVPTDRSEEQLDFYDNVLRRLLTTITKDSQGRFNASKDEIKAALEDISFMKGLEKPVLPEGLHKMFFRQSADGLGEQEKGGCRDVFHSGFFGKGYTYDEKDGNGKIKVYWYQHSTEATWIEERHLESFPSRPGEEEKGPHQLNASDRPASPNQKSLFDKGTEFHFSVAGSQNIREMIIEEWLKGCPQGGGERTHVRINLFNMLIQNCLLESKVDLLQCSNLKDAGTNDVWSTISAQELDLKLEIFTLNDYKKLISFFESFFFLERYLDEGELSHWKAYHTVVIKVVNRALSRKYCIKQCVGLVRELIWWVSSRAEKSQVEEQLCFFQKVLKSLQDITATHGEHFSDEVSSIHAVWKGIRNKRKKNHSKTAKAKGKKRPLSCTLPQKKDIVGELQSQLIEAKTEGDCQKILDGWGLTYRKENKRSQDFTFDRVKMLESRKEVVAIFNATLQMSFHSFCTEKVSQVNYSKITDQVEDPWEGIEDKDLDKMLEELDSNQLKLFMRYLQCFFLLDAYGRGRRREMDSRWGFYSKIAVKMLEKILSSSHEFKDPVQRLQESKNLLQRFVEWVVFCGKRCQSSEKRQPFIDALQRLFRMTTDASAIGNSRKALIKIEETTESFNKNLNHQSRIREVNRYLQSLDEENAMITAASAKISGSTSSRATEDFLEEFKEICSPFSESEKDLGAIIEPMTKLFLKDWPGVNWKEVRSSIKDNLLRTIIKKIDSECQGPFKEDWTYQLCFNVACWYLQPSNGKAMAAFYLRKVALQNSHPQAQMRAKEILKKNFLGFFALAKRFSKLKTPKDAKYALWCAEAAFHEGIEEEQKVVEFQRFPLSDF